MENLLEMAKSDGNTRNFLHECYMADPDHVGTGFGRWLEENKEVLPVYLECMEQIEGRTGYLQEGFMLARMEAGTNLHLNPKDEEKLNAGDPDYVGAFEIVKELIYTIVSQAISGEGIDIGHSAKFHDSKTMLDRLNRTNENICKTIAARNKEKVSENNLLMNIFGNKSNPSFSFLRPLFDYVQKHANVLISIISSGKNMSDIESAVSEFAKDAFLNVIGPYTGGNESVQELANILKDTLSNYQSREDETRAIVMQLVEAYKDESSREETIQEIVGRLNVRTDYPEARDAANKIFEWIDDNPSAEEIDLLKKCDKEIKNNLRKSYVKKIEDAIDNSTVLNKDEKESAKKKLNSGTKQATTFAMFIKSLKDDPDALATRMLYGKGYKVKPDTDAQNTELKKRGSTERDKLNRATHKIIVEIIKGLSNIQTKLKSDTMDKFITALLEKYKSYKNEQGELDMYDIIQDAMDVVSQETGYTDPCGKNNFGNAMMTYVFGIGNKDRLGHARLENCIKNSIEQCAEHEEYNLIDMFYTYMFSTIDTAIRGTDAAIEKVRRLEKSGDKFTDFDLSLERKDLKFKDDDPFEKDAYIYMFRKAGINH